METIELNGKKYVSIDEIKDKRLVVPIKGKTYCVVRTYSAGVFFGLIDRKIKGKENTIYDARRIFYWEGAASLSQLANEGVKLPDKCGNIVKCKSHIPLEHGTIGLVFYPNKNSSKKCNGKYIEVKI